MTLANETSTRISSLRVAVVNIYDAVCIISVTFARRCDVSNILANATCLLIYDVVSWGKIAPKFNYSLQHINSRARGENFACKIA